MRTQGRDPDCKCLWSPVTGRIRCDHCKIDSEELGYFRIIIRSCESDIALTDDPACIAANKRAILVLKKEVARLAVLEP